MQNDETKASVPSPQPGETQDPSELDTALRASPDIDLPTINLPSSESGDAMLAPTVDFAAWPSTRTSRAGPLGDGKQFGRFELIEMLGHGSFGWVYRARDPQLDREVALKIPRVETFGTEGEDRFLREARRVLFPGLPAAHARGRIWTFKTHDICRHHEIGRNGGS